MHEQHSTLLIPEHLPDPTVTDTTFMISIILSASLLGCILGMAFIIFLRSKQRDFASVSVMGLACSIIFATTAFMHYQWLVTIPDTGWIYVFYGMAICIAVYRQHNHASDFPTLSVSHIWLVNGLSVALNHLCAAFTLPTIFITGIFYKLDMAPCLISYFTLSLVSCVIRMYTALSPIPFLFSAAYWPYLGLSTFLACAIISVWWIYNRFQWRFIGIIGCVQILRGLIKIFYPS